MPYRLSTDNQVCLRYESGTYGNVSGAGHWPGLVTEHSPTEEKNVESLRYIGQSTRDVGIYIDGAEDYSGDLTFHPQDWKILVFGLGSCADAGTANAYSHIISAVDGDTLNNAMTSGTDQPFISFQLEDAHVVSTGQNLVRTFEGCMIDSLEISASEGEMTEVSASWVGTTQSWASGAVTAVTAGTLRPFQWRDWHVDIPSGTMYPEVKEMSLSINNNMERPHYLVGSRTGQRPIPTQRDYEISLTLNENTTSDRHKNLYDKYFVAGSTFNMMLVCDAKDTTPGTGSRDAYFIFSGCKITTMDNMTPNEGVNEYSLTIKPQTGKVFVYDRTATYNAW